MALQWWFTGGMAPYNNMVVVSTNSAGVMTMYKYGLIWVVILNDSDKLVSIYCIKIVLQGGNAH